MSSRDEDDILEAMRRFGGSFVQALAELYARADVHNQARLRAAFADEWAKYRDLAERAREFRVPTSEF